MTNFIFILFLFFPLFTQAQLSEEIYGNYNSEKNNHDDCPSGFLQNREEHLVFGQTSYYSFGPLSNSGVLNIDEQMGEECIIKGKIVKSIQGEKVLFIKNTTRDCKKSKKLFFNEILEINGGEKLHFSYKVFEAGTLHKSLTCNYIKAKEK